MSFDSDQDIDLEPKPMRLRVHRDSLTTLFNVVETQPCMLFYVKIIQGHRITKGWVKDKFDTPDPYITISIKTSPHGIQRTTTKDNDTEPVWNETFTFFLHPDANNDLELSLIDANYTIDEHLSTKTINLNGLPLVEERVKRRVTFNETSEVDIEMWAEYDNNPQLRYSLTLCDEEKQFVERRKHRVLEAMKNVLGEANAPKSVNEVPVIGVLGSGGGFRAMTAFCGVMSALVDSGILDMVTYNVGLSGSAWYLSSLYSHPEFPEKSPKQLREEIRNNIKSSPFWLINPASMYRYMSTILTKRRLGQPVSFTDFFGHLVGETLLKNRLNSKLTDQQQKLQEGNIPMPMYSCLHVKKHVSAMVFHEWMEFSPYEIGMPKYGTFMKPELFGSKFFIGHLVKQFEEPPLHFLQGIWGSAFCIQFKRLLQDDKKAIQLDAIEQEREELERELTEEMSMQSDESSDTSDSESDIGETNGVNNQNGTKNGTKNGHQGANNKKAEKKQLKQQRRSSTWTSMFGSYFENHPLLKTIDGRAATVHNFMRGLSLYKAYPFSPFTSVDDRRNPEDKLQASSYFSKLLKAKSPLMKSAPGELENDNIPECSSELEGLLQQALKKPMMRYASESASGEDQFDGIFEMYPTSIKKLYVVDSGLSFNSPYPLLLRPQRGVDLILSFDFSARATDTTPPFKELLLAAEWARLNNVPFPDINPKVVDIEGLKECYVFENANDPRCPIVLHFVLVNITFREEKKPGVRRRTKEEKEYADFDVFDDPKRPYSTFNFKYTNEAFDRLADLTEFNTLLCKDLIVEKIKTCVNRVHQYSATKRRPIMLKDIKKLNLGKSKELKLKHFVQSFDDDDGDFPIM